MTEPIVQQVPTRSLEDYRFFDTRGMARHHRRYKTLKESIKIQGIKSPLRHCLLSTK